MFSGAEFGGSCRGVDYGVARGNQCIIEGRAHDDWRGVVTNQNSIILVDEDGEDHPLHGLFVGKAEHHQEQQNAITDIYLSRAEFLRMYDAFNLSAGNMTIFPNVERPLIQGRGSVVIDITDAAESYRMLAIMTAGVFEHCYYTPEGSSEPVSILDEGEDRDERCMALIEGWQRGHNDSHLRVDAPQTIGQEIWDITKIAVPTIGSLLTVGFIFGWIVYDFSAIRASVYSFLRIGAASRPIPAGTVVTEAAESGAARSIASRIVAKITPALVAIGLAGLLIRAQEYEQQENMRTYGNPYGVI